MKKILLLSLILSTVQIFANKEVTALNALEKSISHYNVLRDFVLAKIAAGHEVPEKRIAQLKSDLEDVKKKTLGYMAITLGEHDKALTSNIQEGLQNGLALLTILENPVARKCLSLLYKKLVQSN